MYRKLEQKEGRIGERDVEERWKKLKDHDREVLKLMYRVASAPRESRRPRRAKCGFI